MPTSDGPPRSTSPEVICRAFGKQALAACAVWLTLTLSLLALPAAAARPALVFGVFPSLTPKVLMETYQPLAWALQRRLGRPVALYTASDFTHFVARTRRGEFDLILTPPHLAWLARVDSGYRPLLKYSNPVQGLLLVRTDSPVRRVDQLAQKTIASANALAVISMAMEVQLRAAGLEPGRNVTIQYARSHNNAAMLAYNGVADAAIVGTQAFRQLPATVLAGMRILAWTPPLSSPMYLTHPRVRDAEAARIHDALLDYAATAEGKRFIQRGGFGGLTTPDGTELSMFRPYALEAQKKLKNVR